MVCKICTGGMREAFSRRVLQKYDVKYYICSCCGFIQTEEPFWLDEAYNDAINVQDIGLIYRNKLFAEIVTAYLTISGYDRGGRYLDYGGGYGMFVRMMRDNGFNFFWSDRFCENIYASKFSINEPFKSTDYFSCITTFEVFEHLNDPISEIEKLLNHTDSIIFSTELIPPNPDTWWYIMPEHGQHISFYSLQTLSYIAGKYNLHLHTNKKTLHVLSKRSINGIYFRLASSVKFSRIFNTLFQRDSLLQKDYEQYLINPGIK